MKAQTTGRQIVMKVYVLSWNEEGLDNAISAFASFEAATRKFPGEWSMWDADQGCATVEVTKLSEDFEYVRSYILEEMDVQE